MGRKTATAAAPEHLPADEHGQDATRRAAALLDQQMWCWGRDVLRPEGNLLLRFGFRKERPPAGVSGGTAYVLTPFPACQLILWPFGLFLGLASRGGLFLRRYEFNPLWGEVSALGELVWDPKELLAFRPPRSSEERNSTQRLVATAARWIGGYEQWVLDTAGVEYRRACLRQWPRTIAPAEAVPVEWRRIAAGCCDFPGDG